MIGSVFRYAIVTLRAKSDPTVAIHGALLPPMVRHRAAIVDEKALGGLMRAIDAYDGWPTVAAAMKFTALTFARPGEVRGALRKEFDSLRPSGGFPRNATRCVGRTTFRCLRKRSKSFEISGRCPTTTNWCSPRSDHREDRFPRMR